MSKEPNRYYVHGGSAVIPDYTEEPWGPVTAEEAEAEWERLHRFPEMIPNRHYWITDENGDIVMDDGG